MFMQSTIGWSFLKSFLAPKSFLCSKGKRRPLIHHSLWDGRKKIFSFWFASDNADQIFMLGSFFDKTLQSWRGKKIEADLMSKMAAAGGRSSPDVFWAEPELSKEMPSWAWPSKIANEPTLNLHFLNILGSYYYYYFFLNLSEISFITWSEPG